MSEPSLPTTPTNRGDKKNLKRTTYERELTPVTAEKQRYGKNSTLQSRGLGSLRHAQKRPIDDAQSLEDFFTAPGITQEKKQTPPVPYQGPEFRNLDRTTYEPGLNLVTALAEKQRYGKNSTLENRGPGRPKRPDDDAQSLDDFFTTPGITREKQQTLPVSYQSPEPQSNPHRHTYSEDYVNSSPPIHLYQCPDSPNYQDVLSSFVLPPVPKIPFEFSPTPSASFRRHTGSPRAPHTGPPIFDPQRHDDWLHRNLVGKNIVSSPDKLGVPLTEDLPRIPILPVEQYSLVQRIKFVNQCLVNAGFPRVGDYLLTLMTETFDSHRKLAANQSKKCTNLQLHEWTWGLPNLLKNLDDFISTRIHNSAWTEKLKLYKANVVDSASTVLESEFRRFAVREDTRRLDPTTGNKASQNISPNALVPSYLQLRASEVTPELLAANLMAETQKQFQSETPLLWQLLSNLIYNNRHQYRESDRTVNECKNSHRLTVVCNALFYSFSSDLRKFQTWFGMYLHASGTKEDTIKLLQQYGLSIGNDAIDKILHTMALKQEGELKDIGKNLVTTPYNLIYDNINIHETVAQQRGNNQNRMFNGVCGFMSKTPGIQHLLSQSDFDPKALDNITSSVLWRNLGDNEAYSKILPSRHIKLAINKLFLEPVQKARVNLNSSSHKKRMKELSTSTRLYLDSNVKTWIFDPLVSATNCPNESRSLPYNYTDRGFLSDRVSVRTVEAEEMSHTGTISFCTNVIKDQLGLTDDQIKGRKITLIGDLGTVVTIHGTQKLRSEDSNTIDSIEYANPLFGLFHLGKALLELILKHYHKPGCGDFAHLDAFIKAMNLRGFTNGKCAHFKKAEDLMLNVYGSYITAWIINRFKHPDANASPTEKRNHAARDVMKLSREEVESQVVGPMYAEIFDHRSRFARSNSSRSDGQGSTITQLDQAGQLLSLIGLYLELQETVKYGRVGKLGSLFELLLPIFAASNAKLYTRELVKMVLLKVSTRTEAYNTMMDSLFVRAKLGNWIAADTACELEIQISKSIYKARGGAFKWENLLRNTALLANPLYNCRVAVQNGHISPELIKLRGQHYKPSMDNDIIGGAQSIIRGKIMDSSAPAMQTIAQPDLFCTGYEKLQVYPIRKVVAYMYDTDGVECLSDVDEGEDIEKDTEMDNIGAVPDDPDLYHEDDIEEEEGTSAEYLQQQRDLLFSQASQSGREQLISPQI